MMYITLTFWLCAAGAAGDPETSCERIALPWYGSFVGCQLHGQLEIAEWVRKAGREGERLQRYRCSAEPVPGTLARENGPIQR